MYKPLLHFSSSYTLNVEITNDKVLFIEKLTHSLITWQSLQGSIYTDVFGKPIVSVLNYNI